MPQKIFALISVSENAMVWLPASSMFRWGSRHRAVLTGSHAGKWARGLCDMEPMFPCAWEFNVSCQIGIRHTVGAAGHVLRLDCGPPQLRDLRLNVMTGADLPLPGPPPPPSWTSTFVHSPLSRAAD